MAPDQWERNECPIALRFHLPDCELQSGPTYNSTQKAGGYRYADEFQKDAESFPAMANFAQEVPIGASHIRHFHIPVSVPYYLAQKIK